MIVGVLTQKGVLLTVSLGVFLDLIEEEPVGLGEVGAEAVVEDLDHLGERGFVVRAGHASRGAVLLADRVRQAGRGGAARVPGRGSPSGDSEPGHRDTRSRPQVARIAGILEVDRLGPTDGEWRGLAVGQPVEVK